MTDAQLEARMIVLWRNFLSATMREDKAYAKRLWDELFELHLARTPEQRARACVLAGLNSDGTPMEIKVEPRV